MLKLLVTFTLLFSLSVCAEEKAKTDSDLLQGTWKVVQRTKNGEDTPDQEVKDHPVTLRFAGDTVTTSAGEDGKKDEAKFVLDGSKTPKHLTFTRTGEVHPGQVFAAIYELNGDTLTLAYSTGDKRETPPGDVKKADGVGTLTLERQKP